jgi:glycosyltransferase involved in cell wall biosynthesis
MIIYVNGGMKMTNKTIWYLPLEDVKSRYTNQLCNSWIPDSILTFKKDDTDFKVIKGETEQKDIKVGQVLDATGRGIFSLSQVINFLKEIDKGNVKNNDVIYIQDFWTPGLEAIQYALDLYKLNDVKFYSMLHAQTVDEYDFTYPMRHWMRPIELGYDKLHSKGGIFVGSIIHKEQLREAGFTSPIHVVSLPIGLDEVTERMKPYEKNTENAIVFSSRMDIEKYPDFMMDVAEAFLQKYIDWKFYVTTSSKQLRGNSPEILERAKNLALKNNRFIIKENLTKDEYYEILCKCKIQLNTSLQDYVSWTLLEATTAGCDICYPNFRSFPEILPQDRMYKPWVIKSALKVIDDCINNPQTHYKIAEISNIGRLLEGYILNNGVDKEYNIWKDSEEVLELFKGAKNETLDR